MGAALWVPRGCLQKEYTKPAFQVPFFWLQKAEKGLGEGGGAQTLHVGMDGLALGY